MKIFKGVQGTQEIVPVVEVGVDTVYIRDNIERITDQEGNELWQYNEKQLTMQEYLREAVPNNQIMTDNAIAELAILFNAYQEQVDIAIAELSIIAGGK